MRPVRIWGTVLKDSKVILTSMSSSRKSSVEPQGLDCNFRFSGTLRIDCWVFLDILLFQEVFVRLHVSFRVVHGVSPPKKTHPCFFHKKKAVSQVPHEATCHSGNLRRGDDTTLTQHQDAPLPIWKSPIWRARKSNRFHPSWGGDTAASCETQAMDLFHRKLPLWPLKNGVQWLGMKRSQLGI